MDVINRVASYDSLLQKRNVIGKFDKLSMIISSFSINVIVFSISLRIIKYLRNNLNINVLVFFKCKITLQQS